MPPFADALTDAAVAAVTGPVGMVLGGVALLLVVIERFNAVRSSGRVSAAAADKAEAEAAATPIAQWREVVADLRGEMSGLKDANRECEERSRHQQAELDEIKRQNAGQQNQIDTVTGKVRRIDSTLKATGLSNDGSGPHHPLPPK
ncbi:hypothetical protein J0H58_27720 [bacterium]|nr:hypothetical protein [bacterium]